MLLYVQLHDESFRETLIDHIFCLCYSLYNNNLNSRCQENKLYSPLTVSSVGGLQVYQVVVASVPQTTSPEFAPQQKLHFISFPFLIIHIQECKLVLSGCIICAMFTALPSVGVTHSHICWCFGHNLSVSNVLRPLRYWRLVDACSGTCSSYLHRPGICSFKPRTAWHFVPNSPLL